MSFSQDNGYIPRTIEQLFEQVRLGINAEFSTSFDSSTFVGTEFYKMLYGIVQLVQESEVTTSQIFYKAQQYAKLSNQKINRPATTTRGIVERFLELHGFIASARPMTEGNAGKSRICVDLDPLAEGFEERRDQVFQLLSRVITEGVVSEGDIEGDVVLSNGQNKTVKFDTPAEVELMIKVTITISENNQDVILDDEEVEERFMAKFASKYALGKDFEPMKYLEPSDVPWAAKIKIEHSDDEGESWDTDPIDLEFDDKVIISNFEVITE